MTGLAHIGSVDVTTGQAVATGSGAGTVDLIMVYSNDRAPGRGAMTGLADVGGVNVATGQTVATGTGTGAIDLRMIHSYHRCPT